MLLACDIGNTNFKFGLFNKNELVKFFVIPKIEFTPSVFNNMEFDSSAISSVIPEYTNIIKKYLSNYFNIDPFVINHKSNFNLKIEYKTPSTLGIDRICSVEGAFSLFKNHQSFKEYHKDFYLVTIDSGTATTINIVQYYGKFIGGIIMPGLQTMTNSLNQKTAQLPQIVLGDYNSFIGNDTKSSIASGVLNSTISLIEKTKTYLETKGASNILFYLTGGNSKVLCKHLAFENFYVEDLVLQGIKAVYYLSLNAERTTE